MSLRSASFAFLVCLFSTSAFANDDVAAARAHYEKGKRAYDLGHYAEAAREYEIAYEAKDDPALLFNLGQAHRLAGHDAEALTAYKSFLRNVPDAPNREEVEARIRALQAAIDAQPKLPAAAAPATSPAPTAATTMTTTTDHAQRPLHKRAWFWAVLAGGAAVVASGVAVGVVLGSSTKDPQPTLGVAGARGF